jgi:hypothetical protein
MNLDNLILVELNTQEVQETDGGSIGVYLLFHYGPDIYFAGKAYLKGLADVIEGK